MTTSPTDAEPARPGRVVLERTTGAVRRGLRSPALVEIACSAGSGVLALLFAIVAWKVSPGDLSLRWAVGGGDQVLHYGIFQSASQVFPFLPNSALGFPEAQNLFFAPLFDPWSAISVSVMSWFSSSGVTLLNVYNLLSFFTVGVSSFWFFRAIGIRRIASILWSVGFATLPFHFIQIAGGHPFLGNYWAVPLIGILLLLVLGRGGTPVERWIEAPTTAVGRRRRRIALIVALALFVGLTQSYYFVFGAIIVGGAWVFRALGALVTERRWWSVMRWPTITAGALAAVIAIQLAVLSLNWGDRYEKYFAGRLPGESELYGGKLALLLLPWQQSGIPRIGSFAREYREGTMVSLTSEGPDSSVITVIGLVIAMLAILTLLALGARGAGERSTVLTQWLRDERTSAMLFGVAWSLLFFIVSGFGTLLAFFVSPEIRAWSRISIVVSMFGIAVLALLSDRILRTVGLRIVAAIALCAVIVVDQGVGIARSSDISATDDDELRTFSAQLGAQLEPGCGVVQLPIKSFPESGTIGMMGDYDHFLPYVYADDSLRFSYGGVRGTTAWDFWADRTTDARIADGILESGACAVTIDTDAYVDDPGSWEDVLTLIGVDLDDVTESAGGRWRFVLVP